MMKISTKLITFGLVLAVAAGAFSGCNDNKDTAEGTTGTAAAATKEAVSGTETENLPEDTSSVTEVTSVTAESVTTETSATESEATEPLETESEATEPLETESEATEPPETEPEYTEGLFMIDYAENILGNYNDYDEYVVDDTDPAIKAVIYTDGVVKDLKFYSLTNPSVDENGRMSFDKTELHSHKYITKDRPILITFTSYGTIPTYGVSVTDAVGDTVCFAITMNGEDGSLLLTEIG
ncbi:MAG: hypothetical protein E7578_09275 [Ruminococcaceae bacterium]|nr:hypothetical protein [Oscillospiraceae bacterium]